MEILFPRILRISSFARGRRFFPQEGFLLHLPAQAALEEYAEWIWRLSFSRHLFLLPDLKSPLFQGKRNIIHSMDFFSLRGIMYGQIFHFNKRSGILLSIHDLSLLFFQFRIQCITKSVPQHIQGKNYKCNGKSWKQYHMRIISHISSCCGKHSTPFRCRRLDTKSDIA